MIMVGQAEAFTQGYQKGLADALKQTKYNMELLNQGVLKMANVAQEALQVAQGVAPDAPAVQVAVAAVATAANPSVDNIISDIELAISLVKQLKASLAGAHPSVLSLIKLLF